MKYIELTILKMTNRMHKQVHISGVLGKLMALLLSAVLLIFVFTFSLLVLLPVVLIGILAIGYQLRKINELHKNMHEQASDSRVIEGEVILETTAGEEPKPDANASPENRLGTG